MTDRQYQDLFDRVPMGLYATAPDGRFLNANAALVRMLKSPDRRTLLRANARDLCLREEDRDHWSREIESKGAIRGFEFPLRCLDGSVIRVRNSGRAVRNRQGRTLRYEGSIEDVTELHAAREALQASELRLRKIVDTFPGVIWTATPGPEYRVTFVSDRVEAMYGYTKEDLLSDRVSVFKLMVVEDKIPIEPLFNAALARRETLAAEIRVRRKDGSLLWTYQSGAGLYDDEGRVVFITGVALDISERKHAEEELRRMERALVDAVTAERQRLGHDLHDVLGQTLTGTAFIAKAIESRLAAAGNAEAVQLVQVVDLINQAMRQVKSIAKGLLPVALHEHGLEQALSEMAGRVQGVYGVNCSFRSVGRLAVADETARLQLFHIAQEAASNAVRHGKPSRIEIVLQASCSGAVLTVKDNGSGFSSDSRSAARGAGLGLSIMRYRASLIGARLDVESVPGKGTEVTCTLG